MKVTGNINDFIELQELQCADCDIFDKPETSSLTVIWFQSDNNKLIIDGKNYTFHKNEIIFLTEFHKVSIIKKGVIKFLRFNRSFYCILTHDNEVGCRGILFFGASSLPKINIPEEELNHFDAVWNMFMLEMHAKDNLQIEMLQMMLKRYLILCARLYKQQFQNTNTENNVNIIREFNFLVETYFKKVSTVAEYAKMLHKSPKTISNIFSKVGSKTPLQYIHERKMLEAKRLLQHSQTSIKEVAYEIGFEDIQAFSRFFKKQSGISPSIFRNKTA